MNHYVWFEAYGFRFGCNGEWIEQSGGLQKVVGAFAEGLRATAGSIDGASGAVGGLSDCGLLGKSGGVSGSESGATGIAGFGKGSRCGSGDGAWRSGCGRGVGCAVPTVGLEGAAFGGCVESGVGGGCVDGSPCGESSRGADVGGNDGVAEPGDVGVSGDAPFVRGRWYDRNKRKRALRKAAVTGRRSAVVSSSDDKGFCETVVSGCPSYGQALSDAECEAKQTLARRRAIENRVASRLAELKLASLEDEKKCQEYADLKKSRVIQWTNEAVAKSQQSLDKCKSIDPASSSSQADIRAQAKELADVKAHFDQFARRVQEVVPNCDQLLSSCRPPGTATMDFLVAQAACSSNAGSFDPLDVTDDMDIKVQGYVRDRGYKAERFPVLKDEVLF